MTRKTQTLESTRRFFLGDLTTPITIYVWRDDANGWLSATASYAIKTPSQLNPDVPQPSGYHQGSLQGAAGAVVALYEAEYVAACDAGNQPAESWLVPVG